jgi:hypothetical protein
MPTIEIRLTVPEGTDVAIITDGASNNPPVSAKEVERYWLKYLSGNARKVYWTAARIEQDRGPGFTLDDIAANISQSGDSVRSWHRTSGRTAKLWRSDNGTDAPVRLLDDDYRWSKENEGMRTLYHLPAGVADKVCEVAAANVTTLNDPSY